MQDVPEQPPRANVCIHQTFPLYSTTLHARLEEQNSLKGRIPHTQYQRLAHAPPTSGRSGDMYIHIRSLHVLFANCNEV